MLRSTHKKNLSPIIRESILDMEDDRLSCISLAEKYGFFSEAVKGCSDIASSIEATKPKQST